MFAGWQTDTVNYNWNVFAFFLAVVAVAALEAANRSGLGLLWHTYGHNRFHHRFGAHSLLFIATF